MENSREEERWVQFQRQRPAGQWTAGFKSQVAELRWLRQYLHDCRFASLVKLTIVTWHFGNKPWAAPWKISCQVITFHSTTMDFSLPFKQTFPLLHSFFFPACSTTFTYKHRNLEPCEHIGAYSLRGNNNNNTICSASTLLDNCVNYLTGLWCSMEIIFVFLAFLSSLFNKLCLETGRKK